MSKTITQPHTSKQLVDKILKEVEDFKNNTTQLSDKAVFSHYETLQLIRNHQNKTFQTTSKEKVDDRIYNDIITPAVESAVSNYDIDTKDFDPTTDNPAHLIHALLAKSELANFFKQTRHGVKINDISERFIGEGNVVARKVNTGDIYKTVNLLNLMPLDPTAESLEDTDVIEAQVMNQTQLRRMTEWENVDQVIKEGNQSKSDVTPEYEIYTRYGELSLRELMTAKMELYGTEYKEQDEDKDEMVQCQIVMARSKYSNDKYIEKTKGYLLFAEKLEKEVIKINEHLKEERYKPYEEAHLGAFKGRWLREGYYEIGSPYQNRANELANQIRVSMRLSTKLILWSQDGSIAGKNVLKSIKDGQIIEAEHLATVNNAEKNLGVYAEQWNQNINLLQKALKDFEVATGETSAGNTSATEINVANHRIGKYYDFKAEKLGLFFEAVFNRWVLKRLMETITHEHNLEITGDSSYMDEYYKAAVDAWYFRNILKIGNVPKEVREEAKRLKMLEIKSNPKQLVKVLKDFYKDVTLYVSVNVANESVSKQNKITNGLALVKYLVNPAITQNPQAMKIISESAELLGFRISDVPQAQEQMQGQPVAGVNLPQENNISKNEGNQFE